MPGGATLRRPIAGCILAWALVAIACEESETSRRRVAAVDRLEDRPERYLEGYLAGRSDSARLVNPRGTFDTDDDGQPESLPRLATGMTLAMIVDGDALFHGKGGCINCHGSESQGLAARGKALTAGVQFIPAGDWGAIDSIISVGMPEAETRSPIGMPPRGQRSNLSGDEIRRIGAYVWAVSQTRGEPWPNGHAIHASHHMDASARTAIP